MSVPKNPSSIADQKSNGGIRSCLSAQSVAPGEMFFDSYCIPFCAHHQIVKHPGFDSVRMPSTIVSFPIGEER